jgi:hypothetical protein
VGDSCFRYFGSVDSRVSFSDSVSQYSQMDKGDGLFLVCVGGEDILKKLATDFPINFRLVFSRK